MAHTSILLSGSRKNFTVLEFDGVDELRTVADYEAPYDASWVECSPSHPPVQRFIGLARGGFSRQPGKFAENAEPGLLYSFEIDPVQKTCKFTSQQQTSPGPVHFLTLRDKSAIVLATFVGGSVALFPISVSDEGEILLVDAPRSEVFPEFVYKSAGHGPNKNRQQQSYVHQVLEDKQGLIYAPDLGSDRVWIFRRQGLELEVRGWLQCPSGTGARHAVFSPDEKIMYVLGELSHTVVAFELESPVGAVLPVPGFAADIVPARVNVNHRYTMDSAELLTHPVIPNVLYASNRWERHIAEQQPHLQDVPKELPPGDSVAIILLSEDGKSVQSVAHVQTKLDVIRGMRLSDDGKFIVVLGQEGGGIEIYKVGGTRGDEWTLSTSLSDDRLGTGIKHAVWL